MKTRGKLRYLLFKIPQIIFTLITTDFTETSLINLLLEFKLYIITISLRVQATSLGLQIKLLMT